MKPKDEMRESPAGMSMFGTFQSCPRKGAFKYVLGFIREGFKSEPLAHGSAVHEGKKIFYGTHDLSKAIDRAIAVALESADSFNSMKIEEERLGILFQNWYETYGEDDLKQYLVITNEEQEIIKLPNGAEITLRMDQVFQDKELKHIYIIDTKTTGGALANTVLEQEYKPQPLLYISSVYKTNPWWLGTFRGWITDVMRQKVNYKKTGELSSISTECKRSSPIMYTEAECNSFLESLTTLTSEIKWAYKSFKEGKPFNACFPMNRNACRSYSSTCPYWPVCFQDFKFNSKVPEPFVLDPWKKEGVIDEVFRKIDI